MLKSYGPVKLLNTILKFFALQQIYSDGNKLLLPTRPWILPAINITLCLIASTGTVYKRVKFYLTTPVPMTRIFLQLFHVLSIFQYSIDMAMVYKKGLTRCVKYYKNYEAIDEMLKLSNYTNIASTVRNLLILVPSCWLLSMWINIFPWWLINLIDNHTLFLLEYGLQLVKQMTSLDLMCQAVQIEHRIKALQELIRRKAHEQLDVTVLRKSYLLLLEQTEYINDFFGLRMLLNTGYLTFYCTNVVNASWRFLTHEDLGLPSFVAMGTIALFVDSAIVLVVVAYRCEQVYRQHELVIEAIDNILVTDTCDKYTRSSLMQFRMFLLSRPISFHAVNYFRLDYTWLLTQFSVVMTYNVILMQFSAAVHKS